MSLHPPIIQDAADRRRAAAWLNGSRVMFREAARLAQGNEAAELVATHYANAFDSALAALCGRDSLQEPPKGSS